MIMSCLPSSRQYLSYHDCLENKCVLYRVPQLCQIIYTVVWAVFTAKLGPFAFDLDFCVCMMDDHLISC